jgi:hypothetical protein
VKDADSDPTFDRARLPMVLAAVGLAGGLAMAGSIERTAGGAIILGAWAVGIVALHRLGRAGSQPAARLDGPQGSGLGPRAKDDDSA